MNTQLENNQETTHDKVTQENPVKNSNKQPK